MAQEMPATDIFSQGDYRYNFEKDKTMRITENGRYGYQDIGELKLNFTLKDGRNIEKNIDLIPLFTDLQKDANIIDLSKSKRTSPSSPAARRGRSPGGGGCRGWSAGASPRRRCDRPEGPA